MPCRAPCALRTRLCAGLEQLRRLLLDDLMIPSLVNPHALPYMQLHHLAARETATQSRDNLQDTDVTHLRHQTNHFRQHIIADEHRHFVGPFGMHSRYAATRVGTVHHIVVYQTRRVQQL